MKSNQSDSQKVLMIGSSGHASVLVEAIELARAHIIMGYLDDTMAPGTIRQGYPILGKLDDVVRVCADHFIQDVVIAIGDNWWRRKICCELTQRCPELRFPVIKHPSAIVAGSAEVSRGTAILAQAHIGPGSRVGEFCILNSRSSIDHDCTLQNFASIAPGAVTGGLVEIGECTAIGVGASISDRISIGSHAVVGTGAVVVRNVPNLVVAYGNPARVARRRNEGEPYVDSAKARSELLPKK